MSTDTKIHYPIKGTRTNNFPLNDSQIEDLRKLRQWHADQCLIERSMQKVAEHTYYSNTGNASAMMYCKKEAEKAEKAANWHIKQVQLLNTFFPFGDTAEM